MFPFSTEVIQTLGTLFVSIAAYVLSTYIQKRTKKNSTLRLIGSIHKPLRRFIKIRYTGITANLFFLVFTFFAFLLIILSFGARLLALSSNTIVSIIGLISLLITGFSYYTFLKFLDKWNQIMRELISDSSSRGASDKRDLKLRWRAVYWATLNLAERYFFAIFIVVISITSALSFLNKGFTILGFVLIAFYLTSYILALGSARFARYFSLRSNNYRLSFSFIDSSDEIESRSFDVIKEPSLCLCVIDDKGNKLCGSLEGVSYNVVLIRDKEGVLVGVPYDYVYRVEECRVKDNNTKSTFLPYI